MGKIQIDTDMLIFALEDHNDETSHYLDLKTGEIVSLTDFDMPEEEQLKESIEAEEDRYIYIEPLDSNESFRVLEWFIDQLAEGKIRDDLYNSIARRRPFRQFKDTLLNYPEVEKQWFLFHDRELKKIAQEWLGYHNIDTQLFPLPGEKKGRRYILSEKQIEYLSYAFGLIYDEIKSDIRTLSVNENETDNLWLWNQLPPIGRASLDSSLAFNLLASLITLVYKFHNEKKFILENRAEELLLHIAVENAPAMAEIDDVEIEDFHDFIEYAYEDLDFLLMYEQKFDGFDESQMGEMMGIRSFSVKDWFKAFGGPSNPYPFFGESDEKPEFPANREIVND